MRVLIAALLLVAATAAVLVTRTGPAGAQAETSLFISGFQAGKGNKPVLRLHNTSPDAADQFDVSIFVRDPATGTPLNIADLPRPLFAGRTLEIDMNTIVSVKNPKYKGPVQVVCFATGGFFRTFGPETIAVEAVQTEGKATYAVETRWVR